jgi:hypothetical protein
MAKKPPKRSPFDNPAPATETAPVAAEIPAPHLGPKGTTGLHLAVEERRNRKWEREHQYGKNYSVKGVRPDVSLWLLETADNLGVRVAEVAVYALMYSMKLVDSGELKVKARPNVRGALMTLFPDGYDTSGGEGVQAAILQLEKRNKTAKEKKKVQKGKSRENWKSKTVTWLPFDQELKSRIIEYCRDTISQGEFVTFLLERARTDYQGGLLTFNPQPRVVADETVNERHLGL